MTEPAYNDDQLLNNHAYRYEIVDQFTAYMKTVVDTDERFEYFLKMTKAMGFELSLNGHYSVFKHPYYNYDGQRYIGNNGEEIPQPKNWSPYYTNIERERGIIIKAYFYEWSKNYKSILFGINIIPIDELVLNYRKQPQTIEYIQYELNQVICDIEDRFELIGKFLQSKPEYERPEEICKLIPIKEYGQEEYYEKQVSKTIGRIEREIKGVASINWGVFVTRTHLKYLLAIWSKIEYKLFLEQHIHQSTKNTGKQQKRINTVARDKHKQVIEKYETYLKRGFTETKAIDALVHDFRREYGKGTLEHTRKRIQDIIRNWRNNKE
ncbi:hypothetical protein GCM10028807_34940 [Spirosoma daeguense]